MQSQQILQSLKTLSKMLLDRGIENNVYEQYDQQMVDQMLQNNIFNIPVGEKHLICYMLKQNKPKAPDIVAIVDEYIDRYSKFIFITNKSIVSNKIDNDSIKKIIQKHSSSGVSIQNFTLQILQFNIMEHEFQPPHTVIRDQDEIKSIMKELEITNKSEFHQIHQSDQVAKYFDLQLGELLKIVREGTTIVYKNCIP